MSTQSTIFQVLPISIEYNGENFLISIANGEMVNVNQLHIASGKKRTQSPNFWLNQDSTKQLIESIAKKYNVTQESIVNTQRGKGGGTMVHWQLALGYASYLGGAYVQMALFESIKDFSLVLNSLKNFSVDQEVINDCKSPLFVYAMKEVGTGNIKIGISKDPQERLRQLQTGNSNELQLVAYREATNERFKDETEAHKANSQYRIRGEWFTSDARI